MKLPRTQNFDQFMELLSSLKIPGMATTAMAVWLLEAFYEDTEILWVYHGDIMAIVYPLVNIYKKL